ncbi:hypothetical protein [Curvibacter gracilis]|uniref:hypothetical protein n=1 Tax=Curvibacter gracilis TaxID=230310 RepID=UPI000485D402|nr:hypothetical protein [Curvibacter gracilis]
MRIFLPVIVAAALLGGLGQAVAQTEASAVARPAIPFLDLPRFDKELAEALQADQAEVGVSFYGKVTPNDVPVRLQKWLTAIEQSGGRLDVSPPPGDVTPRNPALLLGLVSGLWSALKTWGEIKDSQVLQAAGGHQARLVLNKTAGGEVFIERVVFERTTKRP